MQYQDLTTPFRRRQGLRDGIPQHLLDGPAFAGPFRGIRVSRAQPVTIETRARAALLLSPTAVISQFTAAELWGGIVPDTPHTHVTVAKPSHRPQRDGLAAHVYRRPREKTFLRGMPMTTPEQTLLDLVGTLGLIDLVVLGDSLVAAGVTSPEALVRAASATPSRPADLGRRAASLVRTKVESPMETRTRLLMVLAGLPEPEINVVIRAEGRTYRLDLCFREQRLAVEYDGRQHAESVKQWQHDLTRREDFDRWGWRLLVLRADDIYKTPRATLLRIVEAMEATSGTTHGLTEVALREVDRYFPGR